MACSARGFCNVGSARLARRARLRDRNGVEVADARREDRLAGFSESGNPLANPRSIKSASDHVSRTHDSGVLAYRQEPKDSQRLAIMRIADDEKRIKRLGYLLQIGRGWTERAGVAGRRHWTLNLEQPKCLPISRSRSSPITPQMLKGITYDSNDRVAFAADLEAIRSLAFSILALRTLFDWFLAGDEERLSRGKFVVITMDDGSNLDFLDFGAFRSMNSMLRDFVLRRGSAVGERHLATSFVVASPDARRLGKARDFWWRACVNESLIGIESHSWDHCAPNVHPVAQKDQIKGTFRHVETYEDADVQFRKAREYIESVTHSDCRYFAYPWGQRNAYLIGQYLPLFQDEHKYLGCVTTDGDCVTSRSSRCEMPRFVCREHWRSPAQLEQILCASQDRRTRIIQSP